LKTFATTQARRTHAHSVYWEENISRVGGAGGAESVYWGPQAQSQQHTECYHDDYYYYWTAAVQAFIFPNVPLVSRNPAKISSHVRRGNTRVREKESASQFGSAAACWLLCVGGGGC